MATLADEERRPADELYRRDDHDFPLAAPYGGTDLTALRSIADQETRRLFLSRKQPAVDLANALYLDTETSGLTSGTETCAFLVGVGYLEGDSFRVSQFLMRSMAGEPPMLDEIAELAKGFRNLVTYNGATFDMPLLETRYAMHRLLCPFAGFRHLDLLPAARRLYKPRHESATLLHLERTVLGIERDEDIPGDQIPGVFFEYLRTGSHPQMEAVLAHNRYDILTLGALAVRSAERLRDDWPGESPEDIYGVARQLFDRGEWKEAAPRLEQALATGLDGELGDRCRLDLDRVREKLEEQRGQRLLDFSRR